MGGRGVALLVNPAAGRGRGARIAVRVADRLRQGGHRVRELAGTDADDALRLAEEEARAGADALVVVGGDGMVHIAVQALARTPVPLGIVPAGTGNDFARCLGVPLRDPLAAADLVHAGLVEGARPVDLVRAVPESGPHRWYASVLGAGFDSRVNDRANRMRWPRGRARYNLAIVAELGVFRPLPFRIELDGVALDTDAMLVAVGNARSYGAGMRVTPLARLDDGLLDVTIVGPLGKGAFLRAFPRVYRGTHLAIPAVRSARASTVRLEAAGVTAYADGELCAALPVTCSCVPGALQVLAPTGPG